MVRAFAEEKDLKLIDLRASSLTPSDLGVPDRVSTPTGNRIEFLIPTEFPLDTDPLPEKFETINNPDGTITKKAVGHYKGWLLFLDEFMSAPEEVQAAFFKVILDRQIGQGTLHPRVFVVAASNREEHGGIVNPMSTPMKSRFGHVSVESQLQAWLDSFGYANVHPKILAYLNSNSKMLNKLELEGTDTFPCERTWTMASRFITKYEEKTPLSDALSEQGFRAGLEGLLSAGPAHEFISFLRYFDQLPTLKEIIKDPLGTPLPKDTARQWAMVSNIATGYAGFPAKAPEHALLMKYVERMPKDIQVMAVKVTVKRLPKDELIHHQALRDWIQANPSFWEK